ncbi:LysR substrate-binding domain-containing protein [Variovorax sp. JS1663]|uniref:LysR substrate-binding domain-containing protein n=1 Tax=Variovorax sp. JS1663 TaxID=1851577 RepID=UPI0013029C1C|nr:LysR substrate-binding domain-containing protein [Variovorax sp. JS1663]
MRWISIRSTRRLSLTDAGETFYARCAADRRAAGHGRGPCGGPLRANTVKAQLEAALAHLGVALLPVPLAAQHIRTGELTEVLPGHGVEGIGPYLVYASRRQMPRAVRAFIDFAMTAMAAQLEERSALALRDDAAPSGAGRLTA